MKRIVVEVKFTDYINYRETHTQKDYITAVRKMRADAQKEPCRCRLKKCTGKCKYTI